MVRRILQATKEEVILNGSGFLLRALIICATILGSGVSAQGHENRPSSLTSPSQDEPSRGHGQWVETTLDCLMPVPEPSEADEWFITVRIDSSTQFTLRKQYRGGFRLTSLRSIGGSAIEQVRTYADGASCEDLRRKVRLEAWDTSNRECAALARLAAELSGLRVGVVPNASLVLDLPDYEIHARTLGGENFDWYLTSARGRQGAEHPLKSWSDRVDRLIRGQCKATGRARQNP